MPLTDVKCRNAKGQIKPYKLSDGGGLHLLVNADGTKYWRLAYRWHGKQRTLALGVYPAVGLMEARAARDDAKRSLAANIDPSAVKRERIRAAKVATGNTFEAVAREWHDNWKDARTPYYAGQILRRFEADVFPAIGRRPIAELEPPELLDMLRKVEKRGVNETARRLKQLVGQVFRFAIATGRAKRDPSADLKDALRATGEPQRHRAMPLQELPAFLQKLEAYSGERQTKLALTWYLCHAKLSRCCANYSPSRALVPISSRRRAKRGACPATQCSTPSTGWDIMAGQLRTASEVWLPRS
jgi:Arm DNA-binding domain